MTKVVQGIVALFVGLFLSTQLPMPVFDACLLTDSNNRSWYYCDGGNIFAFGFIIALSFFALGPRSHVFYATALAFLLLIAPLDVLRHGTPFIDALLAKETKLSLLGSAAGATIGKLVSFLSLIHI